jgi:hypothetical protein
MSRSRRYAVDWHGLLPMEEGQPGRQVEWIHNIRVASPFLQTMM